MGNRLMTIAVTSASEVKRLLISLFTNNRMTQTMAAVKAPIWRPAAVILRT